MKLLLQLEWGKIRRYRTFWAFIILFAVTLAGISAVLYKVREGMHSLTIDAPGVTLFGPGRLWSTTAWAGGFGVLVLGLLVIVLVTNEFVFKTQRQQVMEGMSRTAFMAGKWMVVAGLTAYGWILYVLASWVLGAASGFSVAGIMTGCGFAGYFLLKIALSLSIAMMIALWVRRAGLAIVIYLLYVIMLEGILGFLLNRIAGGLGDFLPLKAVGTLISNPVSRLLPDMGNPAAGTGWLVAASVAYLVIFIAVSVVHVRHRDL